MGGGRDSSERKQACENRSSWKITKTILDYLNVKFNHNKDIIAIQVKEIPFSGNTMLFSQVDN